MHQPLQMLVGVTGDLLNAIETLQLYGCGKIDLSLLNAQKGKKVRIRTDRNFEPR